MAVLQGQEGDEEVNQVLLDKTAMAKATICGLLDLGPKPGHQVFQFYFFPGPSGLKQIQNSLIDDIAAKVTERDKGLLTNLIFIFSDTDH